MIDQKVNFGTELTAWACHFLHGELELKQTCISTKLAVSKEVSDINVLVVFIDSISIHFFKKYKYLSVSSCVSLFLLFSLPSVFRFHDYSFLLSFSISFPTSSCPSFSYVLFLFRLLLHLSFHFLLVFLLHLGHMVFFCVRCHVLYLCLFFFLATERTVVHARTV